MTVTQPMAGLRPVTIEGDVLTGGNTPLAENGTICDITSTALAALSFAVPASAGPDYRAALTFRTRAEAPRIRFAQPESVWLEGRDCTPEGVFLPQANAHYRIDLAYIRPRGGSAGKPDWRVRGIVSGSRFGGQFTQPQNSPQAIAQVLDLADSWYRSAHPDRPSAYGYHSPFSPHWSGQPQIDCSSFVLFVMGGVTLDSSPYANPAAPATSSPAVAAGAPAPAGPLAGLPRNAADQARWCVAGGFNIDPGDHYERLRGGDLIFAAQGAPARHTVFGARYGWISHVQIADTFLEWTSDAGWQPGSVSAGTGQDLHPAPDRARMPAPLPLPAFPADGLLLALPDPYCFISTHFYGSPDTSSWIMSNGAAGLGFGYLGARQRAWCPVPRRAGYFRTVIGRRGEDGSYQDMTDADYPAAVLSYGRQVVYEVSSGQTPPGAAGRAPFFRRAMSPRNLAGMRIAARLPLSP